MIITCEECSTRFNLDDSLIRPEGSKVRCSQCKHVFTAFPEPETPSEIPASVSDEGPDPDEIPDPGIDPGGADIAPPDVEAPVSEEVEFDDPDSLSQTAGDGFDDITFDEPEMSEEPVPAIPDTDETDTEDTDAESPDFDFDLDEFDQDEFDQDEFDQDMDFGLEEEPDAGQDDTSDLPAEPGGIEDSGLEMETAEETDLREEEVSEDIDFEFEETEISFDDDEIEFEDDNLGFEDTLKAIDDLDSEGFETGDPEDGGIDSLEVDTMETVEMEPDTGFDNLEMEADTIQEGEIELEEPGLEMEEAEPAPEEIQFDEPAEIEFDEPEFDEPGFDEPEDIEFDEPELEDSETEFPDLEFEESQPDSGDETADIEISFDDEDDSPELADLPLEMEPADEIEFEETALPTDVVGDEDEKILGEIDFQGLESDDDEEPDLELSFEEDPDADLVFEEETDEPAPETELPESGETGVDEPPAPMDAPPVFEEDNEEFQASLDAELEEDKFAGYDQVLNQEVEPGQEPASAQDLTEPPPLPPELPPESEEPAPQQESPQQESPLIEPLPEEDVRKRRTRQKKAAIGAPVKVIFLLFLIIIAAYGVSLRFGYTIPFLSDIKIPYLTEALKPEPPPKPVAKPVPNEASINGRFVSNATAGELFIVTGKVENPSDIPYSYIRVKGTLITKDKKKSTTQIVYCGNIISEEELKSGNISDINKKLTLKQGLQNTNENIRPGKSVQFMLVFSKLPENLANFTVEVIDSQTGAGKK